MIQSPAQRPLPVFAVSLLGLVLAACGSSSSDAGATGGAGGGGVSQIPYPEGDMLSFPISELGPFHVGYRSFEITYDPPGGQPPRTIGINIWYPSLDETGTPVVFLKLFPAPFVFEGASLAPPVDPAGYPVHVYSHGSLGFGGASSFLMRHFASHGWVAIAPEHTGNTLGSPDARPASIYYLRSTDISAALDTLEQLEAGDPLAGKCRTDQVAMSGHSFGTLTTWASAGATFDVTAIQAKCDAGELSEPCTPEDLAVFGAGVRDPRVALGVPMAGGATDWFTEGGYDAVSLPFMLMTGTADVSGQGVWDRATSVDLTWLEFAGGCHQLFALGGCEEFDTELGFSLIGTYALAFARRHLLGDASGETAAILSGETRLSDQVTLSHEGPGGL
jgi:hypothetical protein